MVKGNITIESINKNIKIKVGMIIKGDNEENNYFKTINKFTYYGNEYLNINPRAFVTIDISSALDRGEKYSPNKFVNLNRIDLIKFCGALRRLLENFKTHRDLFYIDNTELKVNHQVSNKITETVNTVSHKAIKMIPCVVYDDNNKESSYEGIVMCINSYDNYGYMTYDEMSYMYTILANMDLTSIGMQLLNSYYLTQSIEPTNLDNKKTPIVEEFEDTSIEDTPYVPVTKPNTIPDI